MLRSCIGPLAQNLDVQAGLLQKLQGHCFIIKLFDVQALVSGLHRRRHVRIVTVGQIDKEAHRLVEADDLLIREDEAATGGNLIRRARFSRDEAAAIAQALRQVGPARVARYLKRDERRVRAWLSGEALPSDVEPLYRLACELAELPYGAPPSELERHLIRHCPCGQPLDGKRGSARYCGPACRVAAHRTRRARPTGPTQPRPLPA